jgi:16S rRNA (cytosine1402-N4)-methyltransferase
MSYQHIPVMLTEVLQYLEPQSGKEYFDCTLGGAGYTTALARIVGSQGLVAAIDLDDLAIKNASEIIKQQKLDNVRLFHDNFRNLAQVVAGNFPAGQAFDGIVFDLGLSSAQLDDEARGFSFKGERPLDMSFGPANQRSTAAIVNNYSLEELTAIFRDFGEERQAYRLARAIVAARRLKPFATTGDLVRVIEETVPFRFRSRIHPATRVFQALRMETNEELESLREALAAAVNLLKPGGCLVVVSFHSGEDRIVKRFLKDSSGLEILTKRPLVPSETEVADNLRARSAKLRAAQKPR